MNDLMTRDADRAREVIEMAIEEHDFCSLCGQPMAVAEHHDGLWIECLSLRSQHGLRRLLARAMHDRYPIELPAGGLSLAA